MTCNDKGWYDCWNDLRLYDRCSDFGWHNWCFCIYGFAFVWLGYCCIVYSYAKGYNFSPQYISSEPFEPVDSAQWCWTLPVDASSLPLLMLCSFLQSLYSQVDRCWSSVEFSTLSSCHSGFTFLQTLRSGTGQLEKGQCCVALCDPQVLRLVIITAWTKHWVTLHWFTLFSNWTAVYTAYDVQSVTWNYVHKTCDTRCTYSPAQKWPLPGHPVLTVQFNISCQDWGRKYCWYQMAE